jgi:hypothetical protein
MGVSAARRAGPVTAHAVIRSDAMRHVGFILAIQYGIKLVIAIPFLLLDCTPALKVTGKFG